MTSHIAPSYRPFAVDDYLHHINALIAPAPDSEQAMMLQSELVYWDAVKSRGCRDPEDCGKIIAALNDRLRLINARMRRPNPSAFAAWEKIPDHLKPGLARYLVYGTQPGGFLCAVISNDLHASIMRADERSLAALPAILKFLYGHTPMACWGSEQAQRQWRAHTDASRMACIRQAADFEAFDLLKVAA